MSADEWLNDFGPLDARGEPIPVEEQPLNIALVKFGPPLAHVGDVIQYEFTATTSGPRLHGVTLSVRGCAFATSRPLASRMTVETRHSAAPVDSFATSVAICTVAVCADTSVVTYVPHCGT